MGRGSGAAVGLVAGIVSLLLLSFGLDRAFRGIQLLSNGQTYLGMGALALGGLVLAALFVPGLPGTTRIVPGAVFLALGLLSGLAPGFIFNLPLIGRSGSLLLAASIPLGLVLIASGLRSSGARQETAADTTALHAPPPYAATPVGSVPSWVEGPGPPPRQTGPTGSAQAAAQPTAPAQPQTPHPAVQERAPFPGQAQPQAPHAAPVQAQSPFLSPAQSPAAAPVHKIPPFESATPPPTATPGLSPAHDHDPESRPTPQVTASQTIRIPLSEIPTADGDAPDPAEPPPLPPE